MSVQFPLRNTIRWDLTGCPCQKAAAIVAPRGRFVKDEFTFSVIKCRNMEQTVRGGDPRRPRSGDPLLLLFGSTQPAEPVI